MKPYEIPLIDLKSAKADHEYLFVLYNQKKDALIEYINTHEHAYEQLIEFYIISAKLFQKSDYPRYPKMEEEIVSILGARLQQLSSIPEDKRDSKMFREIYDIKLQIEQKTIFHKLPTSDNDLARIVSLEIAEMDAQITDFKTPELEKRKLKYHREIQKIWLRDFKQYKDKEAKPQIKRVAKERQNDYAEHNKLMQSYANELMFAHKDGMKKKYNTSKQDLDEQIRLWEMVVDHYELKYAINNNDRLIAHYKRVEQGKEYDRLPTLKIQTSEAYKYFDNMQDDFEIIINAWKNIITFIEQKLALGYFEDKLEEVNLKLDLYFLKRRVNAGEIYDIFFEQRKYIVP